MFNGRDNCLNVKFEILSFRSNDKLFFFNAIRLAMLIRWNEMWELTHLFHNRRLSNPVCTPYRHSRRRCNGRICRSSACRTSCRSRCNNGPRTGPERDKLDERFFLHDWECATWVLAGQCRWNSLPRSRLCSPRLSLAGSAWIASASQEKKFDNEAGNLLTKDFRNSGKFPRALGN